MFDKVATVFFLSAACLAFVLPMGSLRIYGNQRKNLYLWNPESAKEMVRPKEWDNLFKAWSGVVTVLVSMCGVLMQLVEPRPSKYLKILIVFSTSLLTLAVILSFSLVHRMEHSTYGNDFDSDIDVKSDAGPGTWLLFGVAFIALISSIISALPSRKTASELE